VHKVKNRKNKNVTVSLIWTLGLRVSGFFRHCIRTGLTSHGHGPRGVF